MSILLEALKKSEAQRRLGETPTLQTAITAEEFSPEEKRYWVPAVMLVFTAALITWMGLAQFRPPATPLESAALKPGESQAEASQDPVVSADPDGNPDLLAKAPVETPVQTPAQTPVETPVKTPVMDYAVAPPPPVSQGAPRKSPVAKREQPANLSRRSVSSSRQKSRGQQPSTTEFTQAAIPDDPAGEKQEEGDRPEPYLTEPLSYWQVPQSVRESMPELHITVLVYAENPQDRFLLINGERWREKEELSEGLVLEEIQRDHAIFTYQKYRFQVKS